jgi:hypothetical protein
LPITKSNISFNSKKNKLETSIPTSKFFSKLYRSPIITVRLGSTSGNANWILSNIGACGLPSIVGERPEAAAIEAKIVPAPKITYEISAFLLLS